MKERCFPPADVCTDDLTDEANLFKVLADPNRLRIFVTLVRAKSEVCVCDFVDGMDLLQPTVSHHLKVLREAGLVEATRRGTWVYYRLSNGTRGKLRTMFSLLLTRKLAA